MTDRLATDPGRQAPADAPDLLRGRAYGLLGTLLAGPPSADLLAVLRGISALPEADADPLALAWAALAGAAHASTPEDTAREYQDLFIGIGRGELLPFGSWYRTGYLMEEPLAELRRDLGRLGFERDRQVKEPEDHAAALCEVMALLCEAEEADPAAQRAFFEAHLAPWMGAFFRDLRNASSARFYTAVGRLGEAFLDFEQRYFAMPA